MQFFKCLLVLIFSTYLTACTSQQDIDMANSVTTALPNEVQGCKFINNVDTYGAFNIGGARFFLKLESAKMGATHVVETLAYPVAIDFHGDVGVGLSGRAYFCPEGKGPLLYKPDSSKDSESTNLKDEAFIIVDAPKD